METEKKKFGRKGGIAFVMILAAASLLLIGSIDGLFTSPSEAMSFAPVAAYSANDTVMEETIAEPLPVDIVSYNASALECAATPLVEESVNESVPANDTVVINASMLVSCRCRTCHSSDDGKKKLSGGTSTTTTIPREIATTTTLNDQSTTTTTLADNTTTTTIFSTTTTTSLPETTTTTTRNDGTTTTTVTSTTLWKDTTTTSVTTTTLSEGTTTTTSTTTTTTIPSADEFSSGWLALAILFFAPAFTYLAAKRG